MREPRVADTPEARREERDPPPVGGSWRRLYAIVLIALAIEIAIFWAFTRVFS